jgi:hypothetical protein
MATALVSVTDTLSRRSSIAVSADIYGTYMLDSPENNARSYMAQASFRHFLTKAVAFHLGYSRTQNASALSNAPSFHSDGIDGGLDYSDSLGKERRTTLSFGTSTSLYDSTGGSTAFRLNGTANLSRAIGRTWSASVGYVRDGSYVPGFQDLVLSDSVTGSFGGLISPRVRWTSSLWWTRGQLGFDSANSANHYTNNWASSTLSFAMTSSLAVYSQYSFNQYRVPPNSTTLTALTNYSRHTVSVGVSAWLPVFNTRRPPRVMGAADNS